MGLVFGHFLISVGGWLGWFWLFRVRVVFRLSELNLRTIDAIVRRLRSDGLLAGRFQCESVVRWWVVLTESSVSCYGVLAWLVCGGFLVLWQFFQNPL